MKRRTPACFASLGQAHRRQVIDFKCQRRIQISQRVVRQSGQMNDRVEASKIASTVTSRMSFAIVGISCDSVAERAALKEIAI